MNSIINDTNQDHVFVPKHEESHPRLVESEILAPLPSREGDVKEESTVDRNRNDTSSDHAFVSMSQESQTKIGESEKISELLFQGRVDSFCDDNLKENNIATNSREIFDAQLRVVSSIVFVVSSAIYVAMEVTYLPYYQFYGDTPWHIRESTDDEVWWNYYNETGAFPENLLSATDDYTWEEWFNNSFLDEEEELGEFLFQVPNAESKYENADEEEAAWVSQYMMLYFCAAVGFFITGVLDLYISRGKQWSMILSGVMILAAAFGIVSAMMVNKDAWISTILNTVSVHLFALEAVSLIISRLRLFKEIHDATKKDHSLNHDDNGDGLNTCLTIPTVFWRLLGDVSFLIGTSGDVVLSYFYVLEQDYLEHAAAAIVTSAFWLLSALLYLSVNSFELIKVKKYFKKKALHGQKEEVTPEKFLVGEELEDSCKKRGVCPLCARTRVRKRVFKFFKKNQWELVTQLSKDRNFHVVYKGYCVVPDCFTLEQAKRLSGELQGDGQRPSGILTSSGISSSNRNSNSAPDLSSQPRAIPKNHHSGSVREETTMSYETDSQRGATLMETNQDVSYYFDRISFFQSSPIVSFEKHLGIHRSISLHDSKYERLMVEVAVDEAVLDGTQIEVTADVATIDRFTSFLAEKNSHVMHLSCYGLSGGLSLENGFGSIQTFPLDGLRRLIAAVGSSLDFVFVSSCSAKMIGEAFVDAGIPHVVCCEKEDAFRDPVAVEFIQCFYREAAKSRNLCDAFEDAVEMITSSQITTGRHKRQVKQRFHLLPVKANSTGYHKKRIFFNQLIPPPKNKDCFERFLVIPAVPDHFTGREIEMYEILESIRVNDIVKITGTPGYGKESVIAAVAEYAMERRKMFAVDNFFWIPTPEGITPEPDSLYDDLCQSCNLIRTTTEDIWDTNDALLECKERLRIELEDIKMILVVDDRSFSSKGCQDALEKFINFIVKNSSSKVVLITSRGNQVSPSLFLTTYNSTVGSSRMIEERTITISTLDFRSTAILFGNLTRFISSLAHTASEFADLLEPPFISRMANPLVVSTQRRADLFARMGNGLPSAIIAAAERINQKDFHQLIKIARKPEFYVESLSELEIELRRRRLQKEKAILDKNYVRATDLDTIIDELEGMRPEFPTLKDLKEKEQSLKAALYDAVDNHRYDTVNDLKRKLLTLKKKIMKESRLLSGQADNRNSKLNQFQAQIETSIEGDDDSLKLGHLDRRVAFSVNCDNRNCIFSFYYGDIYDFSHPSKANGIVCWTNEACDLSSTIEGKELLIRGGAAMQKDLSSLPTIHRTLYGDARCDTGSAILLGPTPEYQQRLPASAIILTVGPFCCSGVSSPFESLIESDDEDILHYTKVMLRSCYRCCMELARQCELKVLGVSLLTTHKTRVAYQNTITIGLQTLIAEAKYSHLTDIHIISKTPKEASLMVSCMLEMGYKMTDDA